MRTEDKVCTFEQSLTLWALGVRVPSFFDWADAISYDKDGYVLPGPVPLLVRPNTGTYDYVYVEDFDIPENVLSPDGEWECKKMFRAYDSSELGEMLPDGFGEGFKKQKLSFHWSDNAFGEGRRLHFPSIMIATLQGGYETEAKCRAEVLIYLIENRYINVESLNNRT